MERKLARKTLVLEGPFKSGNPSMQVRIRDSGSAYGTSRMLLVRHRWEARADGATLVAQFGRLDIGGPFWRSCRASMFQRRV
jgi:hypothetical protein